MSEIYEEAMRLRIEDQDQEDRDSQMDALQPECGQGIVAVTTTSGSYPTVASACYMMQGQTVGGTETEGAAATFTNVGGTFPAFNVGSQVPPIGTRVYCERVEYRWMFRYGA